MGLLGRQIKERLERDLGFEANRARLLVEGQAASDIRTYWEKSGIPKLEDQSYKVLAKSALVSGQVGRQKLTELVQKIGDQAIGNRDSTEISNELSAVAYKHQKTLNLSRNRAIFVNAHLNVLEPEKSLPQIYSSLASERTLKSALAKSNSLLKTNIDSRKDLNEWLLAVHEILSEISDGDVVDQDSDVLAESSSRRGGLISRKAISTYFKQWEMFAKEKLSDSFGIKLLESEISPLSNLLNDLEKGSSRSWTTIMNDITEAKSSTVFQKRATTISDSKIQRAAMPPSNIQTFELNISGRPLKIQKTRNLSSDVLTQFSKAMKAQYLVYNGSGPFNVSLQTNGQVATISLQMAQKADLKKIEDILKELD